jgi:hypothetical protein
MPIPSQFKSCTTNSDCMQQLIYLDCCGSQEAVQPRRAGVRVQEQPGARRGRRIGHRGRRDPGGVHGGSLYDVRPVRRFVAPLLFACGALASCRGPDRAATVDADAGVRAPSTEALRDEARLRERA